MKLLVAFVVLLLAGRLCMADEAEFGRSEWVWPGEDDRLVYRQDEHGNRIPDFSWCGYRGGGVRIPDVPVRAEVEPGDGDDGERIQRAIDELSQRPLDENGFRGAVLLKAGTYEIEGHIRIAASGIVLRGEGQGEDGTILLATGTSRRTLIQISGDGDWEEVLESRRRIVTPYVPLGARGFELQNWRHLRPGDRIIVHRPSTAEWISEIGMDRIPDVADDRQWRAGQRDLLFDREIINIYSGWVTIDAPLTMALDERFGGGEVYAYTFPGRIRNVGVENLRGISQFQGSPEDKDEDHSWTMIQLDRLMDGWVRDVTSYHFPFGQVRVGARALRVTVQDCRALDPVGQITGNRRYPFNLSGQQVLFQRLYSNQARRDFASGANVPGPNVFLDSLTEEAHSYSGPHHRWATGTLYDNIRVEGHDLRVQNRMRFGPGHGWAGANMVFWNCTARAIVVQDPPTARNWSIGGIGEKGRPAFTDDPGTWDSHGLHVQPRSLYLRQLEERLGPQAVDNIAGDGYSFEYEKLARADGQSRWVWRDEHGKLQYRQDADGNRIPDFSHAGYMGGGVAIPDVPVRARVQPGNGDDGDRIQQAIDQVSQMPPDENGLRGAVLLAAGTYHIVGQIRIAAGGIVLRGEGHGEDGTILIATGTDQRPLIVLSGQGDWQEVPGTRRRIVDEYVPVGARVFTVESVDGLGIGDTIIVHRPSTAEWISAIGMDHITGLGQTGNVHRWEPGERDLRFDRVITAIDGDRITIDAPVTNALDQRFGGGEIYHYRFPGRISQVGVENLRGVSRFVGKPEDDDEAHSWQMIAIDRVENAWVRDITSYHFSFGLARIGGRAKWVTVQDCTALEPVSEIRGNRRYPFQFSGQLLLFNRCHAEEHRHDFATGAGVPGPSVFLDCTGARFHGDAGPHHRWATGTLYDNVSIPHGSLRAQNRANSFNGHGVRAEFVGEKRPSSG
jgi:hypothetical protein